MTPSVVRDRLLSLLTLASLLTGSAAPAGAAQEGDIVLHIDGTAGATFAAACELKTAGQTQAFSIDEKIPFDATYVGSGLSCRITAKANIDVQLVKGGSRSNSSSSGGVVRVNVGS
jgi:hypothetical protein